MDGRGQDQSTFFPFSSPAPVSEIEKSFFNFFPSTHPPPLLLPPSGARDVTAGLMTSLIFALARARVVSPLDHVTSR